MSIARYALRSDAVTVFPDGIEVEIGLPWYRSLPWASMAAIEIAADSRPLDLSDASVDGVPIAELIQRDDYWHTQHRARVLIPGAQIGEPGDTCAIDLKLRLRIPGPLLPDGSPMPFDFDARRNVILTAA